jgi:hypothetical protein
MNAVVLPLLPMKLMATQLRVSDLTTLNSTAEKSVLKSPRELADIKRLQVNILDTTNLVEAIAAEEAPLLATEEDPQEAAEDLQEIDTPTEETEIEIVEETDIVQDPERDIIDPLVTEAIPDLEEEDNFYYTIHHHID